MHASITWCVCVCFITAVDAKSRPLHKLQCSRNNSLGSCRQVERKNAIVGVLPPSWQPGCKPRRQYMLRCAHCGKADELANPTLIQPFSFTASTHTNIAIVWFRIQLTVEKRMSSLMSSWLTVEKRMSLQIQP